MITRKIIILTVLGGQAIFIASLLLLIFLSCITQLEVREEKERRWKKREGEETEEKETEGLQGMEGERESVCVCARAHNAYVQTDREFTSGGCEWRH